MGEVLRNELKRENKLKRGRSTSTRKLSRMEEEQDQRLPLATEGVQNSSTFSKRSLSQFMYSDT